MKKVILLMLVSCNLMANTSTGSIENRDKGRYGIGLSLGRELGLAAKTVESSYFNSADTSYFLSYSSINEDRTGFDKSNLYKIGYRKFQTNSFNYKVNMYYLNSKAHYYEAKNIRKDKNFSEAGFGASVGNEWQWKNFSLGADWIGVNQTVLEIDEVTAPFKRNSKTTFSLLNLKIGYLF